MLSRNKALALHKTALIDGSVDASSVIRTEYRYNYLNKLIHENKATTSGLNSWQQSDKASSDDVDKTYAVTLQQMDIVKQHFYDTQGRKVGSTDANGESEGLLLNSNGQAMREMEADGWVKSVGYDVFGNMRESRNAKGDISLMVYDRDNRMIKNFAPKGEVQYDYNELGHRVETRRLYDIQVEGEVSTKKWIVTEEAYDALGNVIYKHEGAGEYGIESGAKYDQFGRKSYEWRGRASANASHLYSQTWEQDYFGRYVGEANVDFGGRTLEHDYNNANQVVIQTADQAFTELSWSTIGSYEEKTLLSNGLQSLEYSYYGTGLVKTVTDNTQGIVTHYEYDEQGQKTQERTEYTNYNNGVQTINGAQTTDTSYDDLGRIETITVTSEGDLNNADVVERHYGLNVTYYYDAVGNRRAVIDNQDDKNNLWYAYDETNKLIASQGQASVDGTNANISINNSEKGVLIGYDSVGNRASTVRRVKGSEDVTKTVTEYFHYNDNNLHTMTTLGAVDEADGSFGNAIIQKRYDLAGRVEYQLNYKFEENGYENADAAASSLTKYAYFDGTDLYRGSKGFDTDGLDSLDFLEGDFHVPSSYGLVYDDSGLLKNYQSDTRWYSYLLGRELIQKSETRSGGTLSGSLVTVFDANGNQIRITDTEGDQDRSFVLNGRGQILQKYQDENLQNYYYNDNAGVASTGQVDGRDLDYNFTPINDQAGLSAPARYTVTSDSESLGAVAAAVWGDASLWYLIADANGLSSGAVLKQGQSLVIPNNVSNVHNSSETFKPYSPAEIVGDISPTVPVPEGPDAGCNSGAIFVQVMAIVIAIVIIVASQGTMTKPAIALVFAASNLAAQYVGTKIGLIEEIDYTAVAVAAISAFIPGAGEAGSATAAATASTTSTAYKVAFYVAQGAAQVVVDYSVRKALGEDVSFSWRNVVTGGIVSGLTGGAGAGEGGIGAKVASSVAKSALSHAVNKALGGDSGKFEWAQVAMNSFGQAMVGKVSNGIGVDVSGAAGKTESLVGFVNGFVNAEIKTAMNLGEGPVQGWWESANKKGGANSTNSGHVMDPYLLASIGNDSYNPGFTPKMTEFDRKIAREVEAELQVLLLIVLQYVFLSIVFFAVPLVYKITNYITSSKA